MKITKWVSHGMVGVLALAASIAYGEPPPKEPEKPGVVAHLAAVLPGHDPGDGYPGLTTVVVLALGSDEPECVGDRCGAPE